MFEGLMGAFGGLFGGGGNNDALNAQLAAQWQAQQLEAATSRANQAGQRVEQADANQIQTVQQAVGPESDALQRVVDVLQKTLMKNLRL